MTDRQTMQSHRQTVRQSQPKRVSLETKKKYTEIPYIIKRLLKIHLLKGFNWVVLKAKQHRVQNYGHHLTHCIKHVTLYNLIQQHLSKILSIWKKKRTPLLKRNKRSR